MRTTWICAALLLGTLSPLVAQQSATPAGLRSELLQDMESLERKYVALAEAVPQERHTWRPADGVRSVSEVFMHVADANYYLTGVAAYPRPEGLKSVQELNALEKITDKPQLLNALRASFVHGKQAIAATPDAKLDEPITLFGQDATVRAALVLLVSHMHEHLGQSIAYARMNQITPPWSSGGN
jgi:uncharacterized damage-inducible protein DinB